MEMEKFCVYMQRMKLGRVVYGLCAGHMCVGEGDSLSDVVLIVGGFDFEGAVVGPEID